MNPDITFWPRRVNQIEGHTVQRVNEERAVIVSGSTLPSVSASASVRNKAAAGCTRAFRAAARVFHKVKPSAIQVHAGGLPPGAGYSADVYSPYAEHWKPRSRNSCVSNARLPPVKRNVIQAQLALGRCCFKVDVPEVGREIHRRESANGDYVVRASRNAPTTLLKCCGRSMLGRCAVPAMSARSTWRMFAHRKSAAACV